MKASKNNSKVNLPMILMAVVIVITLVASIAMLVSGSGKEVAGSVSAKEIKKAEAAEEIGTEIQATTINENITITPTGATTTETADAGDAQDAGSGEYVIPDSNTRRLTDADVSSLSKEQLRLARNEIMARHGRKFKDAGLQSYFDGKSWYSGTVSPEEFDSNMDSRLSEIERANVEMIKKYE